MARKGKIFNRLGRPKLLRKMISRTETVVGVVLLLSIIAMTVWLVEQRDHYDPGERDIETSLLVAQSVEDNLYKTPLKRWRDPTLVENGTVVVRLGPFDPSLLSGGWRANGDPQLFDRDNLFEKINGQAAQYLKFGFEKLQVLQLEHPTSGRYVDVYLYDQGTFEGGLGVYQELRGNKPVRQEGSVQYTSNSLGAIGICGSLFFQITADESGAMVEEMTARVVTSLSQRNIDDSLPDGYATFHQGMQIEFDRIAYQPTNVFQYRFASNFWFASIEGDEDARFFIHSAVSDAAAQQLFEQLHRELLEDYDVIDSSPGQLLLKHQFLETYFGLALEGVHLFGIERHSDRSAAEAQLASLRLRLTGPVPTQDWEADGGDEPGYDTEQEGEN